MTTWLCRLMAAIFTLNVLAPTELLAQARRAPAARLTGSPQPVAIPTNEEIRASVEEKFQDSIAAAQTQYEEAKGVSAMFEAIRNLHAVMNNYTKEKMGRQMSAENQRKKQQELAEQSRRQYVAAADNTRVANRYIEPNVPRPQLTQNFETLASRINSGEISISDLLTYLDPLEGGDLLYTVFAAEIFGNSVDAMGFNDEDTSPETIDFLLEMQLRAIYRLQTLLKGKGGDSAYIMAVGSLRMLLLKVNTFFQRVGVPNPLFEKESASAGSGSAQKAPKSQPQRLVSVRGNDGMIGFRVAPSGKGSGSTKAQAPKPVFSEAMYRQFMNDIMAEIRAYKEKNLKEDDAEYSLLLLALQYAVTYAMDFDPSQVTALVGYFDKGPGKTDFKQQYSSVLNTILTIVFESVKFAPGGSKHTEAIDLFYNFSDPQKYSIPTRIFALEMASLLYRPHDVNDLFSKNAANMGGGNGILSNMLSIDTSPVDERYRSTFAMRTVDIYAPLNRTHYLAMKDYGLDSEQMQALADKMAYIYNGFANDELKFDHNRPRDRRSYVLDKAEDGSTLILNKGNSVPRLLPAGQGQMFQLPDGSLKEVSGFGYCSQGFWVEMNLRNGINAKKRSDEYSSAFAMFVGEAILWVFGGEIIGVAWRVTRGAMMALPKAVRAASLANKGRRMLSFGVEIRKGVRYANLAQTTRLNGITVSASRTEKVRKATNAASAGNTSSTALRVAPPPVTAAAPANVPLLGMAEQTASAAASKPNWLRNLWGRIRSPWAKKYTVTEELVSSPVMSMKGFRNGGGFLRGTRAPVEEWNVLVQQPGFSFQSAVLSGPKATRLQNGIRNWDDWRYLMRNARTAEGARLQVTSPLKPWQSLWQGSWQPMFGMSSPAGTVQREQRVMGATARAFAQDAKAGVGEGVFDYWKYTDKGWVRISQSDFMALGDGMQATAAEALPDYYAMLGIGRNASEAEVKNAAKKMLARWHPDRAKFALKEGEDLEVLQKLYEDTFKKLGEARDVLTNKTTRAAYDAKLAAGAKKVAKVKLPESPEGASLAITRNMGQEVPSGFSPLAEGSRGLGFNASSWNAVDVQLSKHLVATDQTLVLGKSLVMADPFIGGTTANMAFFGAWAGLDEAVNPFMQDWIAATSTEEVEKMQKLYGDAYDPDLMAKDQEESEQALRDLAAQGYNTASPSLYDDVTSAERSSAMGALFSFPLLAGWHGLSKINIARNVGLTSPFNSKQTQIMMEMGAQRIQLQRMTNRYQQVKTQQDFKAFYDSMADMLEEAKASYEQMFAEMSREGLALASERKEIMAYFASVKKSMDKIASGREDANTKAEKINRLIEDAGVQLKKLEQKVEARAEAASFENQIAYFKTLHEDYTNTLYTEGFAEADPSIVKKLDRLFQDMIGKLRKIQKQKISFAAKNQAVQDLTNELSDKLEELFAPFEGAAGARTVYTPEELYKAELRTISTLEQTAASYGVNADALFKDWRKQVDAYYVDTTYTPEALGQMFEIVRMTKLQELDKLFAEQAGAVGTPAKGPVSQEALDELLPDVTSEVSTGA